MKKTLLALSALTVAAATPALAVDQSANQYGNPYATQNNTQYGVAPYANNQYGYQSPAVGYQQYTPQTQQMAYNNPYAPVNNPANNNARSNSYNNFEPAAGSNNAKWPFWYVGLNAGAVMPGSDDWQRGAASGEFDLDNDIGVSATLGYKPSNFRYEVELGYVSQSIDAAGSNGDSEATKLLGNVLYDFDLGNNISPFLGAGLGAVNVQISPTNAAGIDGKDYAPAYQLIGGVSLNNVLPQTDISLAYKYLDTFSDLKEDGAEFEYSAHTLEAGARLRF